MAAKRAIASGKRRVSVVIAVVILTIGAAWPDAAEESSGSVEVGVPFIDGSRSVWDLTSGTIAVLPTGNVAVWERGVPGRKTESVPEGTWLRTRDNVTSETARLLRQYGCSIIPAHECVRRVSLSMRPENRPNEVADLAAYPGVLVAIIPKTDRDLPTETDWQRIFYKEHLTAVRAVGKYLRASYLVTACVTRDEPRGRLLAYFQIYDVASAKVILHVVGAGSYAQPTEGSTPERDTVRSGLGVGLQKLGADSKEEAIQGDPFDPKDIRAFLKAEAQGRSPEISEKHVAEWEACGETYRAGIGVFQRKRGAGEEYEAAIARLDQIGKRLSPENPFQLNVLLLKCKGLSRTGKTTETRACLLAMADKMSAVRSAYGEKCPLIDRIYVPLVTNELGRATVLRKEDSQRVLDYIAHWTANADPTVRTNAWLALGRFWDAAERRDLDKLAHCMGNYYRSLLTLFSSVRDPQRDFWAVYRDQVRYAHGVLLKGGRPDLAKEFVKEIEPSMLMTDQAKVWLQEIRQAAARPAEPDQPTKPATNEKV
jgi:hypothetical protein